MFVSICTSSEKLSKNPLINSLGNKNTKLLSPAHVRAFGKEPERFICKFLKANDEQFILKKDSNQNESFMVIFNWICHLNFATIFVLPVAS